MNKARRDYLFYDFFSVEGRKIEAVSTYKQKTHTAKTHTLNYTAHCTPHRGQKVFIMIAKQQATKDQFANSD